MPSAAAPSRRAPRPSAVRPLDPTETVDTLDPVETESDGRRARRERNRDAVVEAMLGLYREGVLDPSADAIAERAGISARSLFRYFDDIDDLCRAAMARQQEHVQGHAHVDLGPDTPLHARIEALVAQRTALFELIGTVGVAGRLRAPFQPIIAEQVARGDQYLCGEVRRLFAPELAAMGEPTGRAVLDAIEVLTSFEAHRLQRDLRGRSLVRTERALTEALLRLLDAPGNRSTSDRSASDRSASDRPRGDRR